MCIMSYENVKFGNDCRDKIIEGINLAASAVERTFGPDGKNAIIRNDGGLSITKDGFRTAMHVNDPDPYVSMGIDIIQNICKKTANDVGDGTSSSAILAAKLIDTFKGHEDPIGLMRGLQTSIDWIISALSKQATECKYFVDYKRIAEVSSNGDTEISTLIADAFTEVGPNGIVLFEESDEVKDHVEYTQGFVFESSYASPYYLNTPRNTCELENVKVYISNTKIEEVSQVLKLASEARNNHQSLLLIAPEYDSEVHVFLAKNQDQVKSCAVYSPNRGNFRKIMLEDISDILQSGNPISKVIVTNKTTTFIDSNISTTEEKLATIKELANSSNMPELEKKFHQKRLANFTGKVATIYAGGFSKLEMRERYDRIEDAVCAVRAARDGGYLTGGGYALRTIADCLPGKSEFDFGEQAEDTTLQDFISVLKYPSELLRTTDCSQEDLRDVIEPFLVIKTVLQNAISTAALVLTTDVAIINMSNFYNY